MARGRLRAQARLEAIGALRALCRDEPVELCASQLLNFHETRLTSCLRQARLRARPASEIVSRSTRGRAQSS
jgi:hypothetical protein